MGKVIQHGLSDMNRAYLRRREDAAVLFDAGRYRAAMYLAGYAVECLLKAKLMAKFGCVHLRQLETRLREMQRIGADETVFTHNLEPLLDLTGRANVVRADSTLWWQFVVANRWVPAWRYSPVPGSLEEAKSFLQAVDAIIQWVKNNV